jgi:8-oxo-dGTP pyrophosphatase MutT (NUDIX family)
MHFIHTLSSRELLRNPWFRVREDQVEKAGGWRGVHYVVELKPGSSVLAVDSDDRACLIREFKYAVEEESIEVVSGGIEPGETPLETAQRELREEAGLAAAEWTDLGLVNPFTSVIRSPNHLFLARGLTPVERAPDEGEHVEVVWIPMTEAVTRVIDGSITHAGSCLAILKAHHRLSRL